MTYPNFNMGDVLASSDMNAVGLWKITDLTASFTGGTAGSVNNGTVTIGTNNTAVTVSSAFSSNYNNYKIIVNGGAGSTAFNLQLQLGATTTGYYAGYNGVTFAGAATVASDNNAAIFTGVGQGTTASLNVNLDILSPNLAEPTYIGGFRVGGTAGAGFAFAGFLNDTTAYTAFTIQTSTGNMTGGTIRVYGYRD